MLKHFFQPMLWPGILTLVLALGAILGERLNNERFQIATRGSVQEQLNHLRDTLDNNLSNDLQLVKGLISAIALHPDMDQADLEVAARPLFASQKQLRNVAMAPQMVIRMIYPMAGNEAAIGLDYRQTPAQLAAVEQARISRQIVLAGPINLVQGGRGLVARMPVFLNDAQGNEYFWGLVSAVIDTDQLLHNSGLTAPDLPVEIAIRGRDARGPAGEVFFGRADIFDQKPVLSEIALPVGAWQVAAIPKNGWPTVADNAWMLRLGFALIAMSILGIFVTISRNLHRVKQARHALEISQQRLAATLENTPNVAIQLFDHDGHILHWNQASERLFGWTAKETQGRQMRDLRGDDSEIDDMEQMFQQVVRSGNPLGPLEMPMKHRDGTTRWIEFTLFTIPGPTPDQPLIVGMDVDITTRKLAEQALESHQDELELQVAERTQELSEAKARAESASVAKSAFLANMSHEIRTPLNAIVGLTHIVRSSGLPTEQESRVGKIATAGQHLLEIINDILDLSKIEAGKLSLEESSFQLESLVKNVLTMLHDRASAKHLEIDLELPTLVLLCQIVHQFEALSV